MTTCRFASRVSLAVIVVVGALACSDGQPTLPDIRAAAGGGDGGVSVRATDPDSATQDTTLDVVVSGSGFDQGSQAQWAIAGVPAAKVRTNSTRFVTSKKLIANITIAIDADTGLYDVMVTASTGKKGIGSELFTIKLKRNATANPEIAYDGIFVVDADGSNPSSIATGGGPSWAPFGDGTALNPYSVVFSPSLCSMARIDVSVSGATVKGTNLQSFPTPPLARSACYPAWSPLGNEIVFGEGSVNCPNSDCPRPSSLWILPADPTRASEAVPIYDAPSSGSVYWSTWSPTAAYLAFVEVTPSAKFSIRIVDRGSGVNWVVVDTSLFSSIKGLDWARTKNSLAFSGVPPKSNFANIYVLDLDASLQAAGPPRQVMRNAIGPSWSPDDSKLVITSGGIKILDLATGKTSSISGTGAWPDWRR